MRQYVELRVQVPLPRGLLAWAILKGMLAMAMAMTIRTRANNHWRQLLHLLKRGWCRLLISLPEPQPQPHILATVSPRFNDITPFAPLSSVAVVPK
jgi:hypothetical protein